MLWFCTVFLKRSFIFSTKPLKLISICISEDKYLEIFSFFVGKKTYAHTCQYSCVDEWSTVHEDACNIKYYGLL
jgi:hypothetical protein